MPDSIGSVASVFGSVFRQRWARLIAIVTLLFAAIGLLLTIVLAFMVVEQLQKRKLYDARLKNLNVAGETKVIPVYSNPNITSAEALARLNSRYFEALDSLGFGKEIRGFVVHHDFRPRDFLGGDQISSRIDFLLNCYCKEGGHYDLLTLRVDPTTLKTSVTRSMPGITFERYLTLASEGR